MNHYNHTIDAAIGKLEDELLKFYKCFDSCRSIRKKYEKTCEDLIYKNETELYDDAFYMSQMVRVIERFQPIFNQQKEREYAL
jgi:hypothetical protein